MDRSVEPGADFFRFANGGWLKANPIPRDRSYWGVDSVLEQENQAFIRDLVESLGRQDWAANTAQRKVADFYRSGMDEKAIDAAGAKPLEPELARIAAIRTPADIAEEIAHLQTIGVAAPLSLGQMQDFSDSTRVIAVAAQSGLGLPNRDYYLKGEPTFKVARAAYVEHVARMLELAGDAPASAARESKSVMELETRLADASMSDVDQSNPRAIYHPMTVDEARELTPHLDWHVLMLRAGHPEIASLNIGMPDSSARSTGSLRAPRSKSGRPIFAGSSRYLRAVPVQGLRGRGLSHGCGADGAQELQAALAARAACRGQALGFAIGQLYVAQKFPPAAKQAADHDVAHARCAAGRPATLAWMTPATRTAARRSSTSCSCAIGYPDRWRDYSALVIDRGPYVLNVMRANAFEFARQLAEVGRPVDRSEWYMTPQTVNAYYDPSMNSLNVPAGILQRPYFDAGWSDAVNYGATGATVGHEMTHGFDDEGAQFDGYGNLKDWWAPSDLAKFRAATRCISDQYSAFTVGSGMHLQGDLVTGEATADLGGLVLAWRAWHAGAAAASPAPDARHRGRAGSGVHARPVVLHRVCSFLGKRDTAQQAEEMATTDPHPPADDRTNGTLANSPDFQRAFAIEGPGPMVKKDRCVIW